MMSDWVLTEQVREFIIHTNKEIVYNKLCVLLGLFEKYSLFIDGYIQDIKCIIYKGDIVYRISLCITTNQSRRDNMLDRIGVYNKLFRNMQIKREAIYKGSGYYINCDIVNKYNKDEEALIGLSRIEGTYLNIDKIIIKGI